MSESVTVASASSVKPTYLHEYQVPNYFIDEIDLDIDLYDEETIVKSLMRIRHNRLSVSPARDLVLQGEALQLESIKLNGEPLTHEKFSLNAHTLTLHQVPDNFELEIIVKIYPQKNTALSGLYRSGQTYCTQCEAEGFRRITYFMDHPDTLSRFITKISADKKTYPILLSNGNLIASGDLEDGRHWVKWEDPFKKPSYLFALVAGDFDQVQDEFKTQSSRDISLRIFVEKGYADQTAHAMQCVKDAMRWDEKKYGREYDLDIYMIVAIGDFNMGAMENKGLNIFNTKYILAKPETATDDDYIHILSVIGHEYFHNWSGNRVTCRDWFQLSLKEGLTIFRDQTFSEDMLSPAVMRIREVNYLRQVQFPEDAGPLAHPVRPDSYIEINNFYTATVYNKGAEVLRMLRTLLGQNLFRKGMDLYFARHDGQAVTIEDYVRTMEDVSGIDLNQFRRWYDQAGTPIVTVQADYNAQQQIYTLTLHQTVPKQKNQTPGLPLLIPVKMGLLDTEGNPIPLHLNDEPVETEKVLKLSEASQNFQFKHVRTRPVPSLLRDFSAPVKLHCNYSVDELQFLAKHDTDAFNRFEAVQQYALNVLLDLTRDYQNAKPFELPNTFFEMYADLLEKKSDDKFLLSEMLVLPSEKYIGEQMEVVAVEGIHAAREFANKALAQHLQAALKRVYEEESKHTQHYAFNMEAVGRRQLKNRCLLFLLLLQENRQMGVDQFISTLNANMTDTMAAIAGLNNLDVPERAETLTQFYEAWRADALVVDKWLGLHAATKLPIALHEVRKLMRHPAFDIKNPNKVYALIGTFGHNQAQFHAENGEGYAFLAETVQQLDKLNPQVAARMVKPLTMWRRYDKERQILMQEQLELILQDKKVSKDLYELVSKSLEAV